MKRLVAGVLAAVMAVAASAGAQSAAASGAGAATTTSAKPDAWAGLEFLKGTWDAKASGSVTSSGTYTFQPELGGHIFARHSMTAGGCKGPAGFDCDHGDLLYVYKEGPGLKAIYFDNEGHVIHYDVKAPTATSVEFLSEASQPGPQFRLAYELKGQTMAGKFQMKMPGQAEWKSYLEWAGDRVK